MTIVRLATGLNEMVQWDILFVDDFMISHLVDEATRWSAGSVLPDRTQRRSSSASQLIGYDRWDQCNC